MADDMEKVRPFTRLQRLAIASAIVFGCLLVGGTAFIWSGYYNVAASRQHWDITTWVLKTIRDQSIAARASGIPMPNLDDEDLIRLGAEHYRTGCAACHGTPGQPNNPLYEGMLPRPPDLAYASYNYTARELYWIVNSGLKFTGMPPWPAEARSDEVWSLVAFLEYLYQNGPQVYGDLIADLPNPARTPSDELTGITATALENCVRCHGAEGTPPISNLVPMLHGQTPDYLARSIREYREQTRASGFMIPIAHEMSEEETQTLLEYYAGLTPVAVESATADDETLARGQKIAMQGNSQTGVPPCLSCHSGLASPQFPLLTGQSARYIESQINVWRSGLRDRTSYGAIMAQIARRLSEQETEDVAAWFAAQARTDGTEGEDAP